jgi:hypothetical protein
MKAAESSRGIQGGNKASPLLTQALREVLQGIPETQELVSKLRRVLASVDQPCRGRAKRFSWHSIGRSAGERIIAPRSERNGTAIYRVS